MRGKPTPGRALALRALQDVRQETTHVKQAIERHSRNNAEDQSSHALKLALGVTATRGVLDQEIDSFLSARNKLEPQVRDALRIAAFELLFTDEKPYAVVNEGVNLVKSVRPRASRMANAVLRKISNRKTYFIESRASDEFDQFVYGHGFPQFLADKIRESRGEEAARELIASTLERAPIYANALPAKLSDDDASDALQNDKLEPQKYGALPQAFIIENTGRIPTSELIASDQVLISDYNAQTVCGLVAPNPGESFLEVGSGRGTKTILIQSLVRRLGGLAWIHALDLFQFKSHIASKRMNQAEVKQVTPVVGDGTLLDNIPNLPDMFDNIFIDAPCSGTGTLRRHPELIWTTTEKKITSLTELADSLLQSAARRIAPGGILAYATCSVLAEENEGTIERFLESPLGQNFEILPLDSRIRFSAEFDAEVKVHLDEKGRWQTVPKNGQPDGHFCTLLQRI